MNYSDNTTLGLKESFTSIPINTIIKITSQQIEDLIDFDQDQFSKCKNSINTDNEATELGLCFACSIVPRISINEYLSRIQKYCSLNSSIYLVIYSYMKLLKKHVVINNSTVHRLTLLCLILASKLYSDIYYTNRRYSKICGISDIKEINDMESKLLDKIFRHESMILSQDQIDISMQQIIDLHQAANKNMQSCPSLSSSLSSSTSIYSFSNTTFVQFPNVYQNYHCYDYSIFGSSSNNISNESQFSSKSNNSNNSFYNPYVVYCSKFGNDNSSATHEIIMNNSVQYR